MLLAGISSIVAMMALMLLLLVAGAEALWQRRGRRAMTHEPRPTVGTDPMRPASTQRDALPSGGRCPGRPGWHTPRVCRAALQPEGRGASARSSPSIAPNR